MGGFKTSQYRDQSITNAKIVNGAGIETSKLQLETSFRQSVLATLVTDTTISPLLSLLITNFSILTSTTGNTTDKGTVVDHSLDNRGIIHDVTTENIVSVGQFDSTVPTIDQNQEVYTRITNLIVDTQPVNITGVTVHYVESTNIDADLEWDVSASTLTWNSGAAQLVAGDGLYVLTGTNGIIVAQVTAASLPLIDQVDSLTFLDQTTTGEYHLGYFYLKSSSSTVGPYKLSANRGDPIAIAPTSVFSSYFGIPTVYGIDDIPFNSLKQWTFDSLYVGSISFDDIVDVTKTAGTVLVTQEYLNENADALTSGSVQVGYYNSYTGSTQLQALGDLLLGNYYILTRDDFSLPSGAVYQSGANIVVDLALGVGSMVGKIQAEADTLVESTLQVFYNGQLIPRAQITYTTSTGPLSAKVTLLERILQTNDEFSICYQWKPALI